MEYDKRISDMANGDAVEGFYILKAASRRSAANGKPFLNITLSDAGGAIEGKVWDYTGPIGEADAGKIVKIRGTVGEFRGSPQLTTERIRLAEPQDNFNIDELVPTAPIDAEKEIEFVRSMLASIEDADYRLICENMLDRHINSFIRIPAGISVHHGFLSGLLMHTGNMMRIADFLSEVYPDAVDRSLLIAGTFLHDFAKEKEYQLSDLGMMTDLTIEGRLLGHLVMGAEEIDRVGTELGIPHEKTLLLKHMILSHHGKPEFGAAVVPCIAESELLSYIDMIDSRMEIYAEMFETLPVGKVSEKNYFLDKRIYNHG